jgi:hypothetical protein
MARRQRESESPTPITFEALLKVTSIIGTIAGTDEEVVGEYLYIHALLRVRLVDAPSANFPSVRVIDSAHDRKPASIVLDFEAAKFDSATNVGICQTRVPFEHVAV